MQRNFDTGKSKITVDYKDTVSFDAKFLKEINLSFVQYQQTSESKYSLNTFEVSTVNASDVICNVNLMYQLGAYTLLEEGKTVIHEAIQKHFKIVLYHGIMRVAQQHDSVYLRNSMDDFPKQLFQQLLIMDVELQLEQGNKFTMSLIRQTYSAGRFVCMFESYAYACTLFNAFVH